MEYKKLYGEGHKYWGTGGRRDLGVTNFGKHAVYQCMLMKKRAINLEAEGWEIYLYKTKGSENLYLVK